MHTSKPGLTTEPSETQANVDSGVTYTPSGPSAPLYRVPSMVTASQQASVLKRCAVSRPGVPRTSISHASPFPCASGKFGERTQLPVASVVQGPAATEKNEPMQTSKPVFVTEPSVLHVIVVPAFTGMRSGALAPLNCVPSMVRWSQQASVLKLAAVSSPAPVTWIVHCSLLPCDARHQAERGREQGRDDEAAELTCSLGKLAERMHLPPGVVEHAPEYVKAALAAPVST